MKTSVPVLLTVVAAALASACNDVSSPSNNPALGTAFQTLPLGFSNAPSTFSVAPGDSEVEWRPPTFGGFGGGPGRMGGGPGLGGGPGNSFMCGGLGGAFMGGGFGHGFGFGFGPFGDGLVRTGVLPSTCAYDASTGRVTCDPVTHNGLTIVRSASYKDASGTVQTAFDSLTTNTINARVVVTGTATRHDNATSVVHDSSDRTVTGLASGSTSRMVNGISAGTETTTGTNTNGSFTAVRTIGDTVTGVVIPVPSGMPSYPTAGTIIRSMQVTVTYSGQSPTTSSRREVVTYDGSTTAHLTITQDGVTRTCTMTLPHGQLTCQ